MKVVKVAEYYALLEICIMHVFMVSNWSINICRIQIDIFVASQGCTSDWVRKYDRLLLFRKDQEHFFFGCRFVYSVSPSNFLNLLKVTRNRFI